MDLEAIKKEYEDIRAIPYWPNQTPFVEEFFVARVPELLDELTYLRNTLLEIAEADGEPYHDDETLVYCQRLARDAAEA